MIEGIIGFLIGVGFYHGFNWVVERKALAMRMRDMSHKGVAVRTERSERMSEAIVRAMALKKEGMAIKDILKTVAGEYPDVAIQLAAKVVNGKIQGLEGLI